MQREFWLGRWEEGQIGWHQPAAHRALPAFWPDLGIALPPDMRARYYGHLRRLGGSGCRGLLISFEYDQSLLSGPPFCVRESEIVAGFGRMASVRVLERAVIPADNPRFTEAGVRSLTEVSYALEIPPG